MNSNQFKYTVLAKACLSLFAANVALLNNSAYAQSAQAQGEQIRQLESVVVTGSAYPQDAITKPFTVLTNTAIFKQNASTLGEALRYTPGVSTSDFGPNSSRPIVRGQDSDRIKILRNSAASVDVSALSFDHAVPVNIYSLTQIEVVRGPAALAYGGNATGGAVNMVDNRISRQALEGINGDIQYQGLGASHQNGWGGQFNAGLGNGVSLHVDGFTRKTQDLSTPDFTDPQGIRGAHIQNSSTKSDGAAIGTSIQTGNGYMGISTEQYNSEYGVPKSLDVRIQMQNQRHSLEGEQHFRGAVQSIKYRLASTDYQHQEFENGQPATLFSNKGTDGRIELELAPLTFGDVKMNSTTGLQIERTDFSAIGEEAFVPNTSTHNTGAFYIAKLGKNQHELQLGARIDSVDVNADSTGTSPLNGPVTGNGVANGPAAARTFSPTSVSLAYKNTIGAGWTLAGTASRVERAPSNFELYADGLHVATDAYEKGNPNLQEERSNHYELSSSWQGGIQNKSRFSATLFTSRYSNYIALLGRTGANSTYSSLDNLGNLINQQVFDFTAVPARFQGIELLYSTETNHANATLRPMLQYDTLAGERTDGGGNLPRVSPQRLRASLQYSRNAWSVTPEILLVGSSKASVGDPSTGGYGLLNMKISRQLEFGQYGAQLFANLYNLGDKLAYSATTINSVRDYTPLAGRSASVGIQVLF